MVVALFPFAGAGVGLLAATTGGGALLRALAGHAAAGMSRSDLRELGEHLDAGQAGLVVVGQPLEARRPARSTEGAGGAEADVVDSAGAGWAVLTLPG